MSGFREELEFLIGKYSGTTSKAEIVKVLRDLLDEIEDDEDDGA